MGIPEVGSEWVAKVDKPRGATGVEKGDVIEVTHVSISYTGGWCCWGDHWHENFEPVETKKPPTGLTAEGYTPKGIKGVGDNVNSPSHYGQGEIEAIVYIKDFLTKEEYIGYLRGNIAKYLHRWRYKNGVEDLEKAQVYLGWLITEIGETK